jgi:hypothetical protein
VNCRANVAEIESVRARARLARQAVADREPWGVVAWHLVELVKLLKARGMA